MVRRRIFDPSLRQTRGLVQSRKVLYQTTPTDVPRAKLTMQLNTAHVERFSNIASVFLESPILSLSLGYVASNLFLGTLPSQLAHITRSELLQPLVCIPILFKVHFSCFIAHGKELIYVDSLNSQPLLTSEVVAILEAAGRTVGSIRRVDFARRQQTESPRTTCGLWMIVNIIAYITTNSFPVDSSCLRAVVAAVNSTYSGTQSSINGTYEQLVSEIRQKASRFAGYRMRRLYIKRLDESSVHKLRSLFVRPCIPLCSVVSIAGSEEDGLALQELTTDEERASDEDLDPGYHPSVPELNDALAENSIEKEKCTRARFHINLRQTNFKFPSFQRYLKIQTSLATATRKYDLRILRMFAGFESKPGNDEVQVENIDRLLALPGLHVKFFEYCHNQRPSNSWMVNCCSSLIRACEWQKHELLMQKSSLSDFSLLDEVKTKNGVMPFHWNTCIDIVKTHRSNYLRSRAREAPKITFKQLPTHSQIALALNQAMQNLRNQLELAGTSRYTMILGAALVGYFTWIQAKRQGSTKAILLDEFERMRARHERIQQQERGESNQFFYSDQFKTSATFGVEALLFDEVQFQIVSFYITYAREPLVRALEGQDEIADPELFLNTNGKRHGDLAKPMKVFSDTYLPGFTLNPTILRCLNSTMAAQFSGPNGFDAIARSSGHRSETARRHYTKQAVQAKSVTLAGQEVYKSIRGDLLETQAFKTDIARSGQLYNDLVLPSLMHLNRHQSNRWPGPL